MIIFVGLLLLASCSAGESEPLTQDTPSAMIGDVASPTFTQPLPTDTSTPLPPTHTPTQTASATPPPSETPTQTATVSATLSPTSVTSDSANLPGVTAKNPVRIYFISKDVGEVCSGVAVAVKTNIEQTGDPLEDIAAALNQLTGIKSLWWGNLYNPLSYSDMRLADVNIEGNEMTVIFRGTFNSTGNPCENSLIRAQIWSTIGQYSGRYNLTIRLNNALLGDILARNK